MLNNNVLGTAFINIVPNLDNFASDLGRAIASIDFAPAGKSIGKGLRRGMDEAFDPHSTAHAWVGSLANVVTIGEFLSERAFFGIGDAFSEAGPAISRGIGDAFQNARPSTKSFARDLGNSLSGAMSGGFTKGNAKQSANISKSWKKLAPALLTGGKVLGAVALLAGAAFLILNEDAREAFLGIVQNVVEAIPKIAAKIPELVTSIAGAITDALPKIIEGMSSLIEGIVGAVQSIAPAIIKALPVLIETILGAAVELFMGIVNKKIWRSVSRPVA